MTETQVDEVVLYVWPGEWELPSLDPDCLCVMCFLKFTDIPHKIQPVRNPFSLFKNTYPQLVHKNVTYTGSNDIIDYIKTIKNIDKELNDQNYADMLAFLNLFKAKFIPAFIELCWLDSDNTYQITRSAYGKYIKFPMSMIKLRQFEINAENYLKRNYRPAYVPSNDLIKSHNLQEAKECINILSAKLENNTFMFENQPSLIDATLYGYLSVLAAAKFVSSPLKIHLFACSNLVRYAERMQIVYFPLSKEEIAKKREENEKRKRDQLNKESNDSEDNGDEEWSWRHPKRNHLLAIGFALASMFYYAISNELIKIEISDID